MIYFFYSIAGLLVLILLYRFLFSIRSTRKFAKAVLPTIISIKDYAQTIKLCLKNGENSRQLIEDKQIQLQRTLGTKSGKYPEWIFRSGFNPGLRAGTRFFLIHLERLTELLFAITYIIANQSSSFYEYINRNDFPIDEVMNKNHELILIIENYFCGAKQTEPQANFTSDITALEVGLQKIVPNSLELLDISPDYLQLTALVRSLKDMRQVLLTLVSALPA